MDDGWFIYMRNKLNERSSSLYRPARQALSSHDVKNDQSMAILLGHHPEGKLL